jgi:hypothetical protein
MSERFVSGHDLPKVSYELSSRAKREASLRVEGESRDLLLMGNAKQQVLQSRLRRKRRSLSFRMTIIEKALTARL